MPRQPPPPSPRGARQPFLLQPRLTGVQRRQLAARMEHAAEFELAGTRFRILASDPRPLEAFRALYGALEQGPAPGGSVGLEILCHREDAPRPRMTVLANGTPYRVRGLAAVENAAATLLHLASLGVRSHHLIHAGCVVVRGRGVVITAGSGLGKSTLCAHLAVRGAELLSDELAPLDRASGLVSPAPFAVGIRAGAAAGLAAARAGFDVSCRGDRKRLVPVRSLAGAEPGGPVRPEAVVLVSTRAETAVSTLTHPRGPVRVILTRWDDAFAEAASGVPGLRVLSLGRASGLPCLLVEGRGRHALPALLQAAREHGVGIAGLGLDGAGEPDFAGEPRLTRIPAAVGVLEVVKKIIPFQFNELLRSEFGGRLAPFVRELAGLLQGTVFYRLTPGRLEAMLEILEGLP